MNGCYLVIWQIVWQTFGKNDLYSKKEGKSVVFFCVQLYEFVQSMQCSVYTSQCECCISQKKLQIVNLKIDLNIKYYSKQNKKNFKNVHKIQKLHAKFVSV